MSSVFVVGSINLDQLITVDRHPLPGETCLASGVQHFPGGKGANQAVAAARMGASVLMGAAVGRDAAGKVLAESLADEGIDVSHLVTRGDHSGSAVLLVSSQGENSIVVVPASNGEFSGEDVAWLRDEISAEDYLVLQLEIPVPTVAAAIRAAQAKGATVVLNAAPMTEISDLLPGVDVLVVNQIEASELLGAPVESTAEDAQRAARALSGKHALSCVVTMGALGAVFADGEHAERIPSEPVSVVDTTGAGDTFVGVLAASLASGADLASAVRLAVRAASLTCTSFGAQSAMPRREDISS